MQNAKRMLALFSNWKEQAEVENGPAHLSLTEYLKKTMMTL